MDDREREVVLAAQELEKSEFLRRYPHPFLAIRIDIDEEAAEFKTIAASIDMLEQTPTPSPEGSNTESVAALVKRPGANQFSFITIGRTSNNDVVIGLNSVSKCHAVIHPSDGKYTLSDAGSKNGTAFNGAQLDRNQRVALTSGDVFTLSHRVSITFLDSESTYVWLRNARF